MLQGIQNPLPSESWNFCKHESGELCWACNGNAGWQQELLVVRAEMDLSNLSPRAGWHCSKYCVQKSLEWQPKSIFHIAQGKKQGLNRVVRNAYSFIRQGLLLQGSWLSLCCLYLLWKPIDFSGSEGQSKLGNCQTLQNSVWLQLCAGS